MILPPLGHIYTLQLYYFVILQQQNRPHKILWLWFKIVGNEIEGASS